MVEHRVAGFLPRSRGVTWRTVLGAFVVVLAFGRVHAENAAGAGARNMAPPPTATLSSAPNVTAPATSYTFSVTYASGVQVSVATLSSSNILVTAPNGFSVLATYVGSIPNVNSASMVAVYTFTPPGGTWTFASNGTYTLALQAGQVTDVFNTPIAAETLGSFTVALPNPFAFVSPPTANPNPSVPNANVDFTAVAAGTEPLTYVWSFGDGSAGAGSTTSHIYTAIGTYTAVVTVSDANGLTATANISVAVIDPDGDADHDGYSNNVEANLGSNLNSSVSTPFTLPAIASSIGPFDLQATRVTLTFTQINKDQIAVTGALPLTSDFNPSNKIVIVEVGHVVRAFKLDASGNAIASLAPSLLTFSANDSFHLRSGGNARRFKFAIGFGDFQTLFAAQADPKQVLANTPGPAQTKTVRMTIYLDNAAYQMNTTARYRVVRGVGKFGF